jgi:hypothetical protein
MVKVPVTGSVGDGAGTKLLALNITLSVIVAALAETENRTIAAVPSGIIEDCIDFSLLSCAWQAARDAQPLFGLAALALLYGNTAAASSVLFSGYACQRYARCIGTNSVVPPTP